MKFAVIGGGSSYSPGLAEGLFSLASASSLSKLWLMDPSPGRVGITVRLAQGMYARLGDSFYIRNTDSLNDVGPEIPPFVGTGTAVQASMSCLRTSVSAEPRVLLPELLETNRPYLKGRFSSRRNCA